MKSWLWQHWLWIVLVVSVVIYTAHVVVVQSVLWGDTRYYYAYTRSIVMDQDIEFHNEAYRPDVGFPHPPEISLATGRVINKYSPGAPILWIPPFLLGQVLSLIANKLNTSISIEGFGVTNQYVVGISAVGMAVGGLWCFWQTLQKCFSKSVAMVSSVFLLGTTQLFFYTMIDPLNSHSASFLFSALLCWWWVSALSRSKLTWKSALIGGVVFGMLGLIRNQDLFVGVPITIWIAWRSIQFQPLRIHWQRVAWAAVTGLTTLGVLSIQLMTTYFLFGQWQSPYFIQGESFTWWFPDFWRVLFSTGNGLWSFSPMTFLAVIGCVLLFRYSLRRKKTPLHASVLRWWSGGAMIIFALQLYVIAAWSAEIVGGPYGSRMFTSSLPWIGVGVATLLQSLEHSHYRRGIVWGIFGLLFVNNLAQTIIMLKRF